MTEDLEVQKDAVENPTGSTSSSDPLPIAQLPHVSLIKSICDQETERLRFISCLGTFLEDFTDVENSTAKSFGRTISSFSLGKADSLASFGAILEELGKFASQGSGKNHATIASNISSHVCKTFPEYSKINRKKVQAVFQRIAAIQDDLKKAKVVQMKNEENYVKLVKEAETFVRFRDHPESYEKYLESDRESIDEKDKFKSMTFSKMISKMTTNDKKSPAERVAEIVREIDLEERQLEANSKRLTFCRANLLVEAERAVADVVSVEKSRVHSLIDGFMKVFAIIDQYNHKVGESSKGLESQLNSLQFDPCLHIPGDLPVSESQGLAFIPQEEWKDSLEVIHSGIPQVAVRVERFLDILDNAIQYMQRIHQLFDEITDVERSRHRSFKKLLEKYDTPTTAELLSPTATAEMLTKLNKFFISELSELFPVRQLTASIILLVRIMADISAKSGDLSMEEICKEVGAAQKRLTNLRKDLKDGYATFLKNLEASFTQFTKLRAKLQKTQVFLKERNSTVKQAKLNAGMEGGVAGDAASTTAAGAAVTADGEPMRAASPTAERPSLANVVQAAVANNATTAAAAAGASASSTTNPSTNSSTTSTTIMPEVGMPVSSSSNAESSSLYRMASMKNKLENFGSSLRSATKLKQVVGLETPSDRITRIENQIVGLEKEERDLQAQTKKAHEDLSTLMSQGSMDLVNRLMSSKSDLLGDLDVVKSSLLLYVEWGKEREQLLGEGLTDLKLRLDACEKISEQALFSTNVEAAVTKFDIPDIDPFVAMKSEIIDEERKALKAGANGGGAGGGGAGGVDNMASPRPSIVLSPEALAASLEAAGVAASAAPTTTTTAATVLAKAEEADSDDEELPRDSDVSPPATVGVPSTSTTTSTATSTATATATATATTNSTTTTTVTTSATTAAPTAATVSPSTSTSTSTTTTTTAAPVPATTTTAEAPAPSQPSLPIRKFSDADSIPSPPPASPLVGYPASPPQTKKVPGTAETPSTSAAASAAAAPSIAPVVANTNASTSGTQAPATPGSSSSTTNTASAANAANAASAAAASAAAAASSSNVTPDHELRKFGLDLTDRVLESFSCALYPKRGILTHGRLFITQHYLAFSGWPDTRVLLSLASVQKVEKTNTLMYIPNAISITCLIDNTAWATATGETAADPAEEEFFFGSFIERELCFNLIRNLSEIEKRIAEIAASTETEEETFGMGPGKPTLEFGYQTHATMFNWRGNDNPNNANTTSGNGNSTTGAAVDEASSTSSSSSGRLFNAVMGSSTKERAATPSRATNRSGEATTAAVMSPGRADAAAALREDAPVSSPPNKGATSSTASAGSSAAPAAPAASAATAAVATPAVVAKKKKEIKKPTPPTIPPTATVDQSQLKKLENLIADHQLIVLAKKTIPFACHHFFRANFRHGTAYTKYLETQNDFDITNTEWEPSTGLVPEDVAKIAFGWKRRFNNMHPRTTMLMFGPKNCSVKQDQYLSLLLPVDKSTAAPSTSSSSSSVLDQVRIYGGVLLTIYEFDGIPMGDVFKVLQYYVFTPASVQQRDVGANTAVVSSLGRDNSTNVVVGLTIHFRKSSMFKSQIISGSSEESGMQARNWLDGAEKKVAAEIGGYLKEEEGGSGGSGSCLEDDSEGEEGLLVSGEVGAVDQVAGEGGVSSSHVLQRRRSSGRFSTVSGLSNDEQRTVLANATTSIVEKAVATIRQEYDWQLLVRDRVIQGLLGGILLLLLFVVYLFYNTSAKVAALEKLLQRSLPPK